MYAWSVLCVASFFGTRETIAVVLPHRDVQVTVRPGDPAGVEVNRPAAKEPVADAVALEQMVEFRERSELVRRLRGSLVIHK